MKPKHKFSDKVRLEEVVKNSLSKAQVLRQLGITPAGGNYKTLNYYIKLYGINISHFTGSAWNQGDRYISFCRVIPLDDILVEDSIYRSSDGLRRKLINQGLKLNKCEKCGNDEWNGLPIPLELDHINGINNDNRIENLRILCPNCHAQTETYRGRNQNTGNSRKQYNVNSISTTIVENKPEMLENKCLVCKVGTKNKSFCSNRCMEVDKIKNIPSKEELIFKIQMIGRNFSALGREFNVTDNAVRKWFRKYNLL